MALNLLDVLLPNPEEDICIICQEPLSTCQTYELPECKHKYHTHCIVTWFRHRPSSNDIQPTDGACPLCGNKGINYESPEITRRISGTYCPVGIAERSRLKLILREAKKTDAPKDLKKIVKKYNSTKKACSDIENEYALFKKKIKNEPGIYKDTQNSICNLRNKLWSKRRSLRAVEYQLAYFPIIPIIIPTPIDIN